MKIFFFCCSVIMTFCPPEGERTAYYESSQSVIEKNSENIRQLRMENKRLRREQAEGDENIVKLAFRNRGAEKNAYRNMSGKAALTALHRRVLTRTKQLNALKHTTHTYNLHLEELRTEHQRRKPEGSSGAGSADARTRKKEEEAMNLRALENRLEKTQLKCKEAENILSNYLKVKSHLQDESLTFQGQLDNMEAEILKYKDELCGLQVIYKDAQLSKESSKAELQQLEERLCRERKERERTIASLRKTVEERKAQSEKLDRRTQRTTLQPDEVGSEAQRSTTRMAGEEEKIISTFEEAYRRIKEATGVTDIQEIAGRFISQKETHQHLEKLKVQNEEVLLQLKEQKNLLNHQLEDMKYSGEAKLFSDQQMLDECEQQLQAQQQQCKAAKERLFWLQKTLRTARAGVEHLADKLQHITVVKHNTVAEAHPDSDEFVVELMRQCELKTQALQSQLQGTDMAATLKEMEEEEVRVDPLVNSQMGTFINLFL
uniref:ODAD1 central coiled coil region domain-containing protein n=1 Tax=Gouania willdenowi TaxID=441366 RepID=A0A8C5DLU2_GOUWI